ncbi:hypothetical protein NX059_011437 [Plenodomus lindquistii]|nr:hypothetical protein NX059_011437 [Plenodomus lindquistii]
MWDLLTITATALASFGTTFRDHGTIASVCAVGPAIAASLTIIPHPVITWPSVLTLYEQCWDPAENDVDDVGDLFGNILFCELLRPYAIKAMIDGGAEAKKIEFREFVAKEVLQTDEPEQWVVAATTSFGVQAEPTVSAPPLPTSHEPPIFWMVLGHVFKSMSDMMDKVWEIMLECSSQQCSLSIPLADDGPLSIFIFLLGLLVGQYVRIMPWLRRRRRRNPDGTAGEAGPDDDDDDGGVPGNGGNDPDAPDDDDDDDDDDELDDDHLLDFLKDIPKGRLLPYMDDPDSNDDETDNAPTETPLLNKTPTKKRKRTSATPRESENTPVGVTTTGDNLPTNTTTKSPTHTSSRAPKSRKEWDRAFAKLRAKIEAQAIECEEARIAAVSMIDLTTETGFKINYTDGAADPSTHPSPAPTPPTTGLTGFAKIRADMAASVLARQNAARVAAMRGSALPGTRKKAQMKTPTGSSNDVQNPPISAMNGRERQQQGHEQGNHNLRPFNTGNFVHVPTQHSFGVTDGGRFSNDTYKHKPSHFSL